MLQNATKKTESDTMWRPRWTVGAEAAGRRGLPTCDVFFVHS